ncbi:ALKBH8 [Mytilus coruscus]|uniref:tRNA (carboxymethyluridine(34)-5-O)-methyltransferase n=1 Tax=Mytilus coruscus TaxID=42192 RepID=A0A6J8CLC5_MYTCO|nr:ALKBH8 [Mytilus coruscus]
MAAPSVVTKMSKVDKKLKKKQMKFRDMLEKNEGIQISETPTKILCVHNGGLDNSVSREEISTALYTNGSLIDVIMLPKKPYSFVCYKTAEDATKSFTEYNGLEMPPDGKRKHSVILYLSYVNKVPSDLLPCKDLPPGLIVLENFVSEAEENQLISSLHWQNDNQLKHREVMHYGYEFRYDINDVDADDPLPQSIPVKCNEILQKALQTGYVKHLPDQLTVNKYVQGQGIPPHVDTPSAFEDGIMSLSLLSQIVMEFSHPEGQQISVLLPRHSLLIMTGESRYLWSHGITPRKSDIITKADGLDLVMRETRVSFTFRKIIHPKDRIGRTIPFQTSDLSIMLPKCQTDAEKLENSHVQQVYEEIADHFSGTRHTPWPKISQFIKDMPVGSLMADIGCGNGKYLGLNQSVYEVGSDRSVNLSEICHQRSHEVYVGDVLHIPLRSCSFDFCICIAVIHHMSTQERREAAIIELLRILRSGGKLLIYVWAMEQERHKIKSKYLKESKLHNTDKDHSLNSHGNCSDQFKSGASASKENLNRGDSQFINRKTENDSNPELTCDSQSDKKDSLDCTDRKRTEETNGSQADNKTNCCLTVHKNRTYFQQQDVLVPWERKDQDNNTTSFHRYYHVFKEGELEEMCGRISGCCVLEKYYDQGNWAVIVLKQ